MNQLNEELIAEITKNINMSIAAHFEKMTQKLMALVNEKMNKNRQIDYQSFKEKRRQKQALKKERFKRCLRERIKALKDLYSKFQRNGDNKACLKRQQKQINLKRKQSEDIKKDNNLNQILYQRFADQKKPYMVKKYPLASQKGINRLLLKRWRRMSSKDKELYLRNAKIKMSENEQGCSQIQGEIEFESQLKDENQDKTSIFSDQTSKMVRLTGQIQKFTLQDQQQFIFQNQNEELKDSNFIFMQVAKQVSNEGQIDLAENEERLSLKDGQQNE